jgi:N-acyl-D-aspartate/D-glutamate deacylase
MAYDLLIKNGRIVDGSGGPAFRGDVGVKDGKIVEIGKLSGTAERVIDAQGLVVSPGFIDNHCHYDAQVTWDPLCSFSCDHGATSVVFGNCSLSLAPVRKDKKEQRRLAEFLSYVEAIPMEVLDTLEYTWETFPEYLNQMDHHLGVNIGNFIGHTAVRHYVMGEDCQKRTATDDEIKQMQGLVRDGMKAGALGLSVSRNQGHFDPQGVHIPAIWADEKEIFALGDVLRELGTGLIQSGGGNGAEMKDALMSRLSEATGRTVVYNNLGQTMRRPGQWQKQMEQVNATTAKGIRAFPMCTPNRITDYFQMRNTQTFRGMAVWHPICLSSPEEQLKSYADPEVRKALHAEAIEFKNGPAIGICSTWWDYMVLQTAVLPKNKQYENMTVGQIAKAQGKGIIDCFLDLTIEENLDTEWLHGANPELPERDHRLVGWRRACAVPERLWLLNPPALRVGARKEDHVARNRGAPPDLRIGLDLRPLRPRPAAARHGRRHRDLRPRHGKAAAARSAARLPGRRQAHQGTGPGHPHDNRQRPGIARRRQAHRRPARPRAAQQLLQGQSRRLTTTRSR